jgi:tRNA (guanine10-N2)-methyltransferase
VEGIGRHIKMEEQLKMIEMWKQYPFHDEDVSLDHPEIIFKVIENTPDRIVYCGTQLAAQRVNEKSGKGSNDDTYFGRYSLKKRPYLGPTSTDHELALLMANQAQIQPGMLVYDPFVGTGSIALACQHFEAFVMGSDIDMRVLKGYACGRKTKNKVEGLDKIEKFDIYANF